MNDHYYPTSDPSSFLLQTNWVGEAIKWIFLALIVLAIIVPIYLRFFYKGKNRTIEIIKRRKTVRDLYYPRLNAANKSNYIELPRYTIDVKYDGRRHIHTLSCNEDIYNSLKEGKIYNVHINLGEVTKIHKK